MKAILVIDIPDFVNSITKGVLKPIGTVGKLEIGYGSDDGEMTRFVLVNIDGALLKPMPQYMTMKNVVSCDYNEAFVNGFNTCIDEILGEEE